MLFKLNSRVHARFGSNSLLGRLPHIPNTLGLSLYSLPNRMAYIFHQASTDEKYWFIQSEQELGDKYGSLN